MFKGYIDNVFFSLLFSIKKICCGFKTNNTFCEKNQVRFFRNGFSVPNLSHCDLSSTFGC